MNIMMFAHSGSLNRGCEAIVRSTVSLLKQRTSEAKLYLASDHPETDRGIPGLDGLFDGSPRNLARYSKDWFVASMRVKMFQDESYALRKIHHNIISRIKDMDICLSIGGDNYCYGEQPGWYEINRRIKTEGKMLVLWGCSIGEEDMSPRKLEDLKLFDLILTRETLTYEMLRGKGLTSVRLVADPAFTMEAEWLELPAGWQEGNTIGLNYSPLVQKRNPESKDAVVRLIHHIIEMTDMTIALTPHVFDEGNNDYEILNDFYQMFKHTQRIVLLPEKLSATQYKGYIARMRMFIGARTHATIAAYSNFIPTLVLGYSVKSKGIAKDLFGEEKLVLGIQELSDYEKLIGAFHEMLRDEKQLVKQLKNVIPEMINKSNSAADHVVGLRA